jgi:phage gp29-like protein
MTSTPNSQLQATASPFGARTVVGHLDIDSLTPRRIKCMLVEAESGDLAAQAELFERMEEKDGELDAHLRTRKSGVARLKFDIQPADDSRDAATAAALCRKAVSAIPNMHQAIFDLLDAVPKGFSVLEIGWHTDKRSWLPTELHWRPQRWFGLADDGRSLELRNAAGQAEPINPLNFIIHQVSARSGFSARTGLLRSCVRAFIVRHFAWKDWMAFAEVYGMPPRIGRLREDVAWDSDEARQLWTAVRALGMDAAAVVREGNSIDVLETRSGEGSIFESIIDRAGRELTLCILGQLLTSGGDKGGSFSLGRIHNQVRWDLVESDATALAQTLTAQLLTPIVQLNLGADAPVPQWRFAADPPDDLTQLSETIRNLSQAGLSIPSRWVYGKFGIPQPTNNEPTLGVDHA